MAPLLLPIHIIAATVGLITGAIALIVKKGGWLHRKSGLLFVYAIVVMCATAVLAAVVKDQPANAVAGLTTAYLVLTGLWTMRPQSDGLRRTHIALMVMGLAIGFTTVALELVALYSPKGTLPDLPSPPFLLFAVLGFGGAVGDLKVIRHGALRGAPRLVRHLWRMCMAMFITTFSFFAVRERVVKILPAPFTGPLMRMLPVLFVLASMIYWLWRVRSRARRAARSARTAAMR